MIKIKCRGYEGGLIALDSSIIRTRSTNGDQLTLATYEIEIEVSEYERVFLSNVKTCEIELF